jgi:ATP-dependent protease ClpP protease subunit
MIENKETTEIEKFGTVETPNEKTIENGIRVLTIIGQIEGHYVSDQSQKTTKYEHLIPLLVAMEQSDDVKGVLIILNTMGGDVEAGLGLAEMIASMSKPTVSLVIGGSHSIGVPLAVSAKRSFIVPSATMTLHPVRVNGLVVGAPQTYNYFSDMQKRIVDFICRNSRATSDAINQMMMRPDMLATDVGTVLDGKEATTCGLIDRIGGLSDAISALNEMMNSQNN